MKIEIYYCKPWNFRSRAASLAKELDKVLGTETRLIQGTDGIFDVFIDGKRIFSRMESGDFPEANELISKLKLKE